MTPAPLESRPWPRYKWWAFIALIFGAQLGLILWLGARPKAAPPANATGPEMFVLREGVLPPAGAADPALLVLPSTNGFSGGVWLHIPTLKYQLEAWHEPPRFLALNPGDLARADLRQPPELAALREPQPDAPDFFTPDFAPAASTVTLAGDLTNRTLLSQLKTNSWPSATALADSVVQIIVDRQGRVVSPPVLINAGSGVPAADADALDQAANLRFAPLRRPQVSGAPALTWGRLVFHWQAVPPPATNTPATLGQ